MKTRRLDLPDREEDHNFLASVTTRGRTFRRVLARLWLPRRAADRVVLRLYPSGRNFIEALETPFSFKSTIHGLGGAGDQTIIHARKVWTLRGTTRWFGKSREENVVIAEPVDLVVIRRRPPDHRRRNTKVHTTYLLTRCPPLAPFGIHSRSYTGEVKIEKVHEHEFTLAGGLHLRFSHHYHFEDRDDGTLMYPEMVATTEKEIAARNFAVVDERALATLDDFLALVSFATRFRVVCVGVRSSNANGDLYDFYRKYIAPPDEQQWDMNDTVIDPSDLDEFLRTAYKALATTGPHELLVHALHLTIPQKDESAESIFTRLYAALETVVLWHRRNTGMEFVIPEEKEWRVIASDVRHFLTNHPLLGGTAQKERRARMKSKVGELRRVSFADALRSLTDAYKIDLSDLWPLVEPSREGISLSEIRNRIVHGSTLDAAQLYAFMGAMQHMRWTVERTVLSVLGWVVERSNVRPDFLARNMNAMIEFRQDREKMIGVGPAANEDPV